MQVRFIRSPAHWQVALLGLMAIVPCHGQSLPDPTRPAAAWLAAQPRAAGAAAEAVAEPTAPGVHIVVIGPTRKFAMVDGHAVRQGESYNGSRLAAINQDGLVWQRGGAREKSNMSPNVQKTEPGKRGSQQPAQTK